MEDGYTPQSMEEKILLSLIIKEKIKIPLDGWHKAVIMHNASVNANIRLEFMLAHLDIPWDYEHILQRPDINLDFIVRSGKYSCDTHPGRVLRMSFENLSPNDIHAIIKMCDHPKCVPKGWLKRNIYNYPIPVNVIEYIYTRLDKREWKKVCRNSDPDDLIIRWPDTITRDILLNKQIQERHILWAIQKFHPRTIYVHDKLRAYSGNVSPEFIVRHKDHIKWWKLESRKLPIETYKGLGINFNEDSYTCVFDLLDLMNNPDVTLTRIDDNTMEWILLNGVNEYNLYGTTIDIDVLDLYPEIFQGELIFWASVKNIRTMEQYAKHEHMLIGSKLF